MEMGFIYASIAMVWAGFLTGLVAHDPSLKRDVGGLAAFAICLLLGALWPVSVTAVATLGLLEGRK